jgi:hypothetical protein
MASLTLFRKKTIPSDTQYGDDISVTQAGKPTVSENLTEQVTESDKRSYITSARFVEGSTRVYVDGMYMTNGVDYVESGDKNILFKKEPFDSGGRGFFPESTVLSIVYLAK